jgi:hypothetical protein
MVTMRDETNREQYFDNYERLLSNYRPEAPEAKEIILSFLRSFPEISNEPEQAFLDIQQILVDRGYEYDNSVFSLEQVIQEKRGNCLGLGVLFGIILEARGYNPGFEVAVNPKDGHYANDLKQFEQLTTGGVFAFDDLPELPSEKVEFPQNRFVPLEHPIISLGNKRFETTTLLTGEDVTHTYTNESARQVSLENLLGSIYVSEAKIASMEDKVDYNQLISTTKAGLRLWPTDRQGWFFLRDLALQTFDDSLIKESEQKFQEIGGEDSLYYFSLYEITSDTNYLDKALRIYPAYIEAYLQRSINRPLDTEEAKADARFDFTASAIAVANSQELSLDYFYFRNVETIRKIFGDEEAQQLLYDIELDNKMPLHYHQAMFDISKDIEHLITAANLGALDRLSPREKLYFCATVLAINSPPHEMDELRNKCDDEVRRLKAKYGNSKMFQELSAEFDL